MSASPYERGNHPLQEAENARFDARTLPSHADFESSFEPAAADFRTPADPEAGWASRNPDRALLFLFVSPRECGALEELMAL